VLDEDNSNHTTSELIAAKGTEAGYVCLHRFVIDLLFRVEPAVREAHRTLLAPFVVHAA